MHWFTIHNSIGETLGWRAHLEEAQEAMRWLSDDGAQYVLRQPDGVVMGQMERRPMSIGRDDAGRPQDVHAWAGGGR